MKKSLIALATLAAATGAFAQSSVTLFGVADTAITSTKTGAAKKTSMTTSGLNSSRLGFRGEEDLGGGLKAAFHMEAGVNTDSGAGATSNTTNQAAGQLAGTVGSQGLTFNRRMTASLMGGFGEVRLGRDYTPSFWNLTVFDPFGTNGLGSSLNLTSTLGSGATTLVRANNTVGYFLPAMGGVYGQVQAAAGEGANGNKYIGGRIGYAGGPVNVAAAFGKTYKDGGLADDFSDINFGGSYNLGFMSIMATYDKRDFLTRDQKNVMFGIMVPFGQSTLKFSYNKASGTQGTSATDFDAKQIAFGYQYDLSKRTAIYATLSSLNNDGTAANGARFTVGQGPAMTIGGDSSKGYNLGVRHSF